MKSKTKKSKSILEGWDRVDTVTDHRQPFRFNTRSNVDWKVNWKKGSKVEVETIETGITKVIPAKTLVYLEY